MERIRLKALIVGHISLDHRNNEILLGGPPLYQIPILESFGYEVDVLTSFNPVSLDAKKLYPNVKFYNKKSKYTTTFQFIKKTDKEQVGDDRTLKLLTKASRIQLPDLKLIQKEYDIVIISPIASEISKNAILGLSKIAKISYFDLQGIVRNFHDDGEVFQKFNENKFNWILSNIDVIKASKSEISDSSQLQNPTDSVLIITDGGEKLEILSKNKKNLISLEKTKHVDDDTGSGDIFLATFAALYKKIKLPKALHYAHEVAKLNLSTIGIPNRENIKNQMKLLGI